MTLEYERLHENLKLLKMDRINELLDNYLEIAAKEEKSVLQVLDHLFAEEVESKKQRHFNVKLRVSNFPFRKTLEEFDFSFQPSIDRKVISTLASMKFAYNNENVVFLGPPGVGKTHLAIGLGMEALKSRLGVYFISANDLIQQLKDALRENSLERKLRVLCKNKVLIIDEIGYLPLEKAEANLFFQLVSRRYERGSIVLTSNLAFREWGRVFGDEVIASAILDRLLHHATVVNIKGESYRLKERKRMGVLRKDEPQEAR